MPNLKRPLVAVAVTALLMGPSLPAEDPRGRRTAS
jgi:hypothetical protein